VGFPGMKKEDVTKECVKEEGLIRVQMRKHPSGEATTAHRKTTRASSKKGRGGEGGLISIPRGEGVLVLGCKKRKKKKIRDLGKRKRQKGRESGFPHMGTAVF